MHTHNDILSFPLCSTLFSHYMIYLKFKIIGSQVSSSCAFSSNWPFSCPFILPSPSFYYLVKPFSLWYFLSWLPFHVYSAIPRFHKLNTQSKDLRLGDIYMRNNMSLLYFGPWWTHPHFWEFLSYVSLIFPLIKLWYTLCP